MADLTKVITGLGVAVHDAQVGLDFQARNTIQAYQADNILKNLNVPGSRISDATFDVYFAVERIAETELSQYATAFLDNFQAGSLRQLWCTPELLSAWTFKPSEGLVCVTNSGVTFVLGKISGDFSLSLTFTVGPTASHAGFMIQAGSATVGIYYEEGWVFLFQDHTAAGSADLTGLLNGAGTLVLKLVRKGNGIDGLAGVQGHDSWVRLNASCLTFNTLDVNLLLDNTLETRLVETALYAADGLPDENTEADVDISVEGQNLIAKRADTLSTMTLKFGVDRVALLGDETADLNSAGITADFADPPSGPFWPTEFTTAFLHIPGIGLRCAGNQGKSAVAQGIIGNFDLRFYFFGDSGTEDFGISVAVRDYELSLIRAGGNLQAFCKGVQIGNTVALSGCFNVGLSVVRYGIQTTLYYILPDSPQWQTVARVMDLHENPLSCYVRHHALSYLTGIDLRADKGFPYENIPRLAFPHR